MGCCLTCSKSAAASASDRLSIDKSSTANHNNNLTSQQQQRSSRRSLDLRDSSEIEGLLPATTTLSAHDAHGGGLLMDSTAASTTTTAAPTMYGMKQLLKKPMNGSSSGADLLKATQLYGQISDNKINALFETYRDEEGGESDAILAMGIERLCCDLHYQPEDFAILVLAWRLDASQMCRFTKAEFIQGLHTLNADSIDSIRSRLEEEVVRLRGDGELFKNLYRFTFRFGLEPELRTLPLDMAISLWRLVFTVHPPKVLDKWLCYLGVNPQQIRGIPKDTWNMFLNFAETCDIDICSYSDEDAWPSVFDDFVEYEHERRKKGMGIEPGLLS